jgi:hypothetical protein
MDAYDPIEDLVKCHTPVLWKYILYSDFFSPKKIDSMKL